jgi:hypothetical protein
MSARALSAMPHKFTAVIKTRPIRHSASMWWVNEGKRRGRFAAPAARLTATVSTFGVGRWQCVGSGRLSAPTIGPSVERSEGTTGFSRWGNRVKFQL